MHRFLATALSLAALAATTGCMSPPKDLDLALTRPSVDNKYIVTLQPPALGVVGARGTLRSIPHSDFHAPH